MVIVALISGAYLMMVVKKDTLEAINNQNKLYELFLAEEARNSLELNDSHYFQSTIDKIIDSYNDHLVSVELINRDRVIVASAPPLPELEGHAIRIPIYGSQHTAGDRFDEEIHKEKIDSNNIIGYLVIRYNDSVPAVAINRILIHFVLLILIIIILVAIGYGLVYSRLIRPFGFLNKRINKVSGGEISIIDVRQNYLEISHNGLNDISRLIQDKDQVISQLEEKLANAQSNVDFANLTKIELIDELLHKLSRPAETTRDLLITISSLNSDNTVDESIKFALGCMGEVVSTLNDTRIILENTDMFVSFCPIQVNDFSASLKNQVNHPTAKIIHGFMSPDHLNNMYINIEDMHFYQLLNQIVSFSFSISQTESIFLNVRIEESSDNKAVITVDISNSGLIIDHNDLNVLNRYLSDVVSKIHIFNIDQEHARIIKYLIDACNISFSLHHDGRGGVLYQLIFYSELNDRQSKSGSLSTAPLLKGVCFQRHAPDRALKNHLRHVGIILNHWPLLEYNKISSTFVSDSEVDYVLVDFTDGDIDLSLSAISYLKSRYVNCFTVAILDRSQNNRTDLIDQIFQHGFDKVMIKPFIASTLVEVLSHSQKNDEHIIDVLINKLTKNH